MACLASVWISCVEIVSCYKSPAFCHVLALAQQAVIEVQFLGCSFEHLYLPEEELEQNQSRNGKAEQRPEFFMDAECSALHLEKGKLRKEMFKYLLRNV